MSYNLSVKHEEKYICIEVCDELTQKDIDDALKEIENIRREQKVDNILCDQHKLQIPPQIALIFETAKRLAAEPFIGMRLAIVRKTLPDEHFFENVANNRSGTVKIFDDEEKAKDWFLNN